MQWRGEQTYYLQRWVRHWYGQQYWPRHRVFNDKNYTAVAGNRVTRGCFRYNGGYSRTITLTFYPRVNLDRRVIRERAVNFNNKVNEVHRIYNAISKVACIVSGLCNNYNETTICTVIRRITGEFRTRGNSVVYHILLKLSGGRHPTPAPRTEATRCCGGHPYPRLYGVTTSVLSSFVGGRGWRGFFWHGSGSSGTEIRVFFLPTPFAIFYKGLRVVRGGSYVSFLGILCCLDVGCVVRLHQ